MKKGLESLGLQPPFRPVSALWGVEPLPHLLPPRRQCRHHSAARTIITTLFIRKSENGQGRRMIRRLAFQLQRPPGFVKGIIQCAAANFRDFKSASSIRPPPDADRRLLFCRRAMPLWNRVTSNASLSIGDASGFESRIRRVRYRTRSVGCMVWRMV